MTVRIEHGDCLEILPTLDECSIDAVVTDPPYHLQSIVKRFAKSGRTESTRSKSGPHQRTARGFMGKLWDGGDIAMNPATWEAVYRVLKPGAHLIALCGTRTEHRVACAIEDAGFEIRDRILWLYGTGFPKSHNQHEEWEGWGTALKPAMELGVLARKPPIGTVAENLRQHGTGALNIDGCRVHCDDAQGGAYAIKRFKPDATLEATGGTWKSDDIDFHGEMKPGRWPANVIHDGSEEVVTAFPDAPGQSGSVTGNEPSSPFANIYGDMPKRAGRADPRGDVGTAARFFYSAKATKADRLTSKHPTVKPVDLMAYLARLITPPGGTILDPFAGSGTTGMACIREGFDGVLIEREDEYVADIKARFAHISGADCPLFQEIADA